MSRPIHLYVSSSPDLYVEREAVAQIVAALPLTIGWRIGHTPPPGQLIEDNVVRVVECDLYSVILGHDFAAPMGFELRQALARGQRPMAVYRKDCSFSPSAQEAVRTLDVPWQRFSSLEAFRSMFKRDLLQAVLQQATALGLELDEFSASAYLIPEIKKIIRSVTLDEAKVLVKKALKLSTAGEVKQLLDTYIENKRPELKEFIPETVR